MSARIKLRKIWQIICEKDSSGYNGIAPYIFSNQPSDEDTEDLIGMDAYVHLLKTAIASGNRMIGVLSDFGVGKSTLIKRLQRSYEDSCERVKVVNINLWSNLQKNKEDAAQLHKSYLFQFATQINKNLGTYVNRRINSGYGLIKISTVRPFTICLLIISVIIFLLSKLIDEKVLDLFSEYPDFPKYGIILAVILFVMAICFSEILFASPKFQESREANEQDFTELYNMIAEKATRRGRKTVIVFDDIDRALSPNVVYDFLKELHKIYLISTEKYKNISYIINIKPEKLLGDEMSSSYSIYSKIFDYMISLQPVNKADLRSLLEKYIQKNKSFYLANNIKVKDDNNNVDNIKGMLWICHGENLDIRSMKKRLNYANQLLYSLNVRFPEANNISFEKCAIVAYLEDRYPDGFYNLKHYTIGEIIGKYNSASAGEKSWELAVNSTIPDEGDGFKSDLAAFLQNEQIDSDYRRYFYNYPKICVIRSYEEDKVFNAIIGSKPLDKQFDSVLQTAIEKNPKIVLEAYKSIRLRGSSLPASVFENETLLYHAINNEDKLVTEYLKEHINIAQTAILSALMKKISDMHINNAFHKSYSGIIRDILYQQLLDMKEAQVIENRKSFMLSVGASVKYYRKLYLSNLPSISLGELNEINDPDIAMELVDFDKVDKHIVSLLFEMVMKNPTYSLVYKKFEKLVKATVGKTGRGFSDAFYAPILCKYLKHIGKINGNFENVIINAIRKNNFSLKEYISVINSIPVDKLQNSTYKNIKYLSIHNSLSNDICRKLLERKFGLEYFANMRDRLDNIKFTGKYKDLFVSSSKRIFELYPDLFKECRRRLCKANPQSITKYYTLFKNPYPIISSQELNLIDLTSGIKLVDSSQLSDSAAKDIASVFCMKKRNVLETAEILDYVCSLRTYKLRAAIFYMLNFEQLSYNELENEKKNQIRTRLRNALELAVPAKAIDYMYKTRFLDSTLEEVVLKKGNDTDYQNYGKLLFEFSHGTEITRQILINDRKIRERSDFALQILFDQKKYDIYVASLCITKKKFIFEPEKINELGQIYWQIYTGKTDYNVTRQTMLDNEDVIEYIYSLDREFTTDEEYLIPFSVYPQTDKLLDTLCSCSTTFVQKYVMKSNKNLSFSAENTRQRFLNHGLSYDEWLFDKDIRKTIYNACRDEVEKKRIIARFKKNSRNKKKGCSI